MDKSEESVSPRAGGWASSYSPLPGQNSAAKPHTTLTQILQQNGNINLVSEDLAWL